MSTTSSAWADGWVTYEDKTIAEVASEFNRRNRVKIVIVDAVDRRRGAWLFSVAAPPIRNRSSPRWRRARISPSCATTRVLRVELSQFVEDCQDPAGAAKPPENGGAI